MQFGMPTLIEIEGLEDTMKLCSQLGLEFVELNMNLPSYQVEKLELTDCLLRLQDKYQLGYTIHLDENLNVCDFNQAVAEAYADTVRRTIAVAKVIDASVLNMHMNHGVHFTLPDRKVELFDVYVEEYMYSWEKFRKMCESEIGETNVKICIENTNGYREYEKKAINYLLESKVFGVTWDIGHSNSVQNIDEEFIISHEAKLKHFHIHDSLGEKDHMVLGTGEIDLNQKIEIGRASCRERV